MCVGNHTLWTRLDQTSSLLIPSLYKAPYVFFLYVIGSRFDSHGDIVKTEITCVLSLLRQPSL